MEREFWERPGFTVELDPSCISETKVVHQHRTRQEVIFAVQLISLRFVFKLVDFLLYALLHQCTSCIYSRMSSTLVYVCITEVYICRRGFR